MSDISVAADQDAIADSLLGEPQEVEGNPPGGDQFDGAQFGNQFPDQAEVGEQEVERLAQDLAPELQQPEPEQAQEQQPQSDYQQVQAQFNALPPERQYELANQGMAQTYEYVRQSGACNPQVSRLFVDHLTQAASTGNPQDFAEACAVWAINLFNTLNQLSGAQQPQEQSAPRQSRSAGRQSGRSSGRGTSSRFRTNGDIFSDDVIAEFESGRFPKRD